ncbi:MAG: hypothetical protein WBA13_16710 [Microcoleaceae cyanobacterium]
MTKMQEKQRQRTIQAFKTFQETPLAVLLEGSSEGGLQSSIELFHRIAATVPAYQALHC